MSVRTTVHRGAADKCALYDSVTGLAFGPVFDSEDEADSFLEHLKETGERDPRVIPAIELAELHAEWEAESW